MTPAEHIARAEQLLALPYQNDGGWTEQQHQANATEAVGHALIAIAVELGAPHTPATSAVPSA